MIFTNDTVAALGFMSAVADTVPEASESGEDELATTAQLVALLDAWVFSGRRDGDRRIFTDPETAKLLEAEGIKLTSWKEQRAKIDPDKK